MWQICFKTLCFMKSGTYLNLSYIIKNKYLLKELYKNSWKSIKTYILMQRKDICNIHRKIYLCIIYAISRGSRYGRPWRRRWRRGRWSSTWSARLSSPPFLSLTTGACSRIFDRIVDSGVFLGHKQWHLDTKHDISFIINYVNFVEKKNT